MGAHSFDGIALEVPGDLKEKFQYLWMLAWHSDLKSIKQIRKTQNLSESAMSQELAFQQGDISRWKKGNDVSTSIRVTKRLICVFSGDESYVDHIDTKGQEKEQAKTFVRELHEYWERSAKEKNDEIKSALSSHLRDLEFALREEKLRAVNKKWPSDRDSATVVPDRSTSSVPSITTALGETRRLPRVREVVTARDEISVVTLSVEVASHLQIKSGGSEISPLMAATIEFGQMDFDDGVIYFTAATVRMKGGDLVRAAESNVEIFFNDFNTLARNSEVVGYIDWVTQQAIGEKRGVRDDPFWKINNIANKISKDGVRVSGIELGPMSVRYLCNPPPPPVRCEFQAVVALNDMVMDFGPENNCSSTQIAKRRAFDQVLANKHMKGNGREAIVSSSVVQIEPDDGLPR